MLSFVRAWNKDRDEDGIRGTGAIPSHLTHLGLGQCSLSESFSPRLTIGSFVSHPDSTAGKMSRVRGAGFRPGFEHMHNYSKRQSSSHLRRGEMSFDVVDD
jgi:hypothetical protein